MTGQDSYSVAQAERFGWSSLGDLNSERLAFLESHLPEGSVLDLGCGPGGWSRWMSSRGHRVVSVDAQSIYLQAAQGLDRRIQASALQLPFRDSCIDSIVCMDVLEHLDDDLAAIREMRRIARKRILLTLPREDATLDRYNLTFLHWQDRTHRRAYTEESVRDLLHAAGCHGFTILPELSIPWTGMARELGLPRDTLANRVRRARATILDLLARPRDGAGRADRIHRAVMKSALSGVMFPETPSGLAVVVELRS
jgi:SAM-dependent methyltransferase